MFKHLSLILSIAFLATGCLAEAVEEDVASTDSELMSTSSITSSRGVVANPLPQLSSNARRESNSWNWSWAKGSGGWWFTYYDFNWYGNGGYCTSYSWGNRCNSSRDTWFITPGWGANFQYYWGQPNPSGWSTFGQHPYWCNGSGAPNTWQGWSLSNHC